MTEMSKNVWWSHTAMYLAERVYDNLALQVQGDGSGLSRRAIQAPKLMMYESREINLPLLDMWPGDAIDLFSADSLCNAEDKYACSVEFLQKQCISGVPDFSGAPELTVIYSSAGFLALDNSSDTVACLTSPGTGHLLSG